MARDIKDTPLLVGDDAVRFEIASHNIIPETKENIEKAKEDFEYLKSICVDDIMKDCEVKSLDIELINFEYTDIEFVTECPYNGGCKVGDYNCSKCKFFASIKTGKSYYCDGTKIYSGTVGCRCSAYLDEQIYEK